MPCIYDRGYEEKIDDLRVALDRATKAACMMFNWLKKNEKLNEMMEGLTEEGCDALTSWARQHKEMDDLREIKKQFAMKSTE